MEPAAVLLWLLIAPGVVPLGVRQPPGREVLETGRVRFVLACARCHGEDGNSDNYPFIKALGGIGRRCPNDEILRRMRPVPFSADEISVRSHVFSRRDLDALVAYVATL